MTKTINYSVGCSIKDDAKFHSAAVDRYGLRRFLGRNDSDHAPLWDSAYVDRAEFPLDLVSTKEPKTSKNSTGTALVDCAPIGNKKCIDFGCLLSFSGTRASEFCNCILKVLNFVRCSVNSFDKSFAFNVIFNSKENTSYRSGASNESTQEHHIFPSVFVLINICQHEKDKKYCCHEGDVEDHFIGKFFVIKHLLYLRGLISNLSLSTKFYSLPRSPLFLVLLEKTTTFLYPSSKGLLAPTCLKTMLLQGPASSSGADSGLWPQYLCIAIYSRLFRTRSGQIPIPIGRRRCFLFRKSVSNKRMTGGLCDVSM